MHVVRILLRGLLVPALAISGLLASGAAAVVFGQGFDYETYRPYESRIEATSSLMAIGTWGDDMVLVGADGTVQVFDVTDPLHPLLLDQSKLVWDEGFVSYAAVSGPHVLCRLERPVMGETTYIVVRIGSDGRFRWNDSGFLQEPGGHYFGAQGFAWCGDLMFIAGTRSFGTYPNIFVYRTTDSSMTWLGLVAGPRWPLAMAAKDNRLFVSSAAADIFWSDFSPEGTVLATGTLDVGTNTRALTVSGDLLFAVEPDGVLDIVDVSGSVAPTVVSRTQIGGSANAVTVQGQFAMVADAYLGVRRVDISDPAAPVVVDTLLATAGATHVTTLGRYVAAASRTEGAQIIDPAAAYARPLRAVSPWITGASAAWGSMVFGAGVVDGQNCVVLVDVSDPYAPRLVDSLPTTFPVSSGDLWATMSDSLAILGNSQRDTSPGYVLCRWDASEGFTGSNLNNVTGGAMSDAAIRGGTVYVTGRDIKVPGHIWVLDARDVGHVPVPRVLELDFLPTSLELQGDVLWCGGRVGGTGFVCAMDVSTPGEPFIRGSTKVPGAISGISVEGDVLCGRSYMYSPSPPRLFDISKTNAVTFLADLPTVGGITAAELDGDNAYVASASGLKVYSIADARHPRLLGSTTGPLPFVAIGSDALLASGPGGLLIMAKQAMSATTSVPLPASPDPVLTVRPNPFNPRLRISLAVERPGQVVVEVFDVGGRRLVELLRSTVPAGELEATWDGRDGAGRSVPSGAYFVRGTTPDGATTCKAVLVR